MSVRSRPLRYRGHPHEVLFSQLHRPLRVAEEDGEISRFLGLMSQRQHQLARQDLRPTPASVRYVHPWPSRHHPRNGGGCDRSPR